MLLHCEGFLSHGKICKSNATLQRKRKKNTKEYPTETFHLGRCVEMMLDKGIVIHFHAIHFDWNSFLEVENFRKCPENLNPSRDGEVSLSTMVVGTPL